MELEITWKRAVSVWWAYLWRNLVTAIVAAIAGMFLGFFLGLIASALGVPVQAIRPLCALLGFAIGLTASVVPVKLILGKDSGSFGWCSWARRNWLSRPTPHL